MIFPLAVVQEATSSLSAQSTDPQPTYQPVPPSSTEPAASNPQKDLLLAESKEKLRSIKQLLKTAKESQDREREQYENQLDTTESQLNRERLEFNRERDSIVKRYESALDAKDNAHQDTLDQLKTLQQLLSSQLNSAGAKRGNVLEMSAGNSTEPEVSLRNIRSRRPDSSS